MVFFNASICHERASWALAQTMAAPLGEVYDGALGRYRSEDEKTTGEVPEDTWKSGCSVMVRALRQLCSHARPRGRAPTCLALLAGDRQEAGDQAAWQQPLAHLLSHLPHRQGSRARQDGRHQGRLDVALCAKVRRGGLRAAGACTLRRQRMDAYLSRCLGCVASGLQARRARGGDGAHGQVDLLCALADDRDAHAQHQPGHG